MVDNLDFTIYWNKYLKDYMIQKSMQCIGYINFYIELSSKVTPQVFEFC